MPRNFSKAGTCDNNIAAGTAASSQHRPRRRATYRAILCALGLGTTAVQASEVVELANLGAGGFRIDGIDAGDRSGRSVSGAGDVNGDGLADLIIGADLADPGGESSAGESYVVFGKPDNASVDLANLGEGGFRIDGIDASDFSGRSVSGAGDVNGDGLADLIIGAPGGFGAGESYVVFGPSPIAGPLFFTDREQFLNATAATAASADYVEASQPSLPLTSGQIILDTPTSFEIKNWPAVDFPDDNDIELAINGIENLDIALAEGFSYAIGVDFNDAAGGSTSSTFDVTVFAGDTRIASFQFETGLLPDQNYIGVWAQVPFNRLEIRETTTVDENEFFGTVSTSQTPLPNLIFADRFARAEIDQ